MEENGNFSKPLRNKNRPNKNITWVSGKKVDP